MPTWEASGRDAVVELLDRARDAEVRLSDAAGRQQGACVIAVDAEALWIETAGDPVALVGDVWCEAALASASWSFPLAVRNTVGSTIEAALPVSVRAGSPAAVHAEAGWVVGTAAGERPVVRADFDALVVAGPPLAGEALDVVVRTAAGELELRVQVAARSHGRSVLRPVPERHAELVRYHDLVARSARPRTARRSDNGAQVWDVFAASGLLGTFDDPDAASERRDRYAAAIARLAGTPQLGFKLDWVDGRDEPFATVSCLKAYERTWFGLHLAKPRGAAPDGTPGKHVLDAIFNQWHERMAADPSARWLVNLLRDHPGFPQAAVRDDLRFLQATGASCEVRSRVVEIAVGEPLDEPADDDARAATNRELALVADAIAARRPRAYCEAFDLVAERLAGERVAGAWAAAGLDRQRAVLVVPDGDGGIRGVAIAERLTPGLHLYDLLDVTRLYAFGPGVARTVELLLDRVEDWYRAAGRARFVLLVDDDLPLDALTVGRLGRDLGEVDQVVLDLGFEAANLGLLRERLRVS
ncbi:hypothetical protein PAI11_05280 [Patulibacter medicamentivorans]|uniref:Uncharacterized protein n=1 Tax=Patulibacter medicamentivorans TaxID=1097667 RepID=H0E168_9ACTN|nr:hypothetical protein [Patulibacter medicamentivorans]EHN12588.1 hypothetical protein PAI11_05280 [Patulibacter medicamentivorans]